MPRKSAALPNTTGSVVKGKLGIPHRSPQPKAPEDAASILERLLLHPRATNLNGEATQLSTLKVILLHLLQKEMAGSRRARNALLKYREFANRGTKRELEIRFAANGYAAGGAK